MPLTAKGRKVKSAMEEQYGKKKGEEVFYASQNKGKVKGTHNPGGGANNRRVQKDMERQGASDAEAIMAQNKADRDGRARSQRRY